MTFQTFVLLVLAVTIGMCLGAFLREFLQGILWGLSFRLGIQQRVRAMTLRAEEEREDLSNETIDAELIAEHKRNVRDRRFVERMAQRRAVLLREGKIEPLPPPFVGAPFDPGAH